MFFGSFPHIFNVQTVFASVGSWFQESLIYQILTYLLNSYFSVEFGSYENFSLNSTAGSFAQNIILGLALGLIIASAMIVHAKTTYGRFVRRLVREECFSPENAKTLSDLGYFRNASLRKELSHGMTLRKYVRCVEEERNKSEEFNNKVVDKDKKSKMNQFKVDFTCMRFYLPEEQRIPAEVRFDKKGTGWGTFWIITAVTVVVAALLCRFLPDLFQFADNILSLRK